jgi:hypothetical protein
MAILVSAHSVFKSFSWEAFNNLKDVDTSIPLPVKDKVVNLIDLLKKFSLNKLLGVVRIHNHFHVTEGDIHLSYIPTEETAHLHASIGRPVLMMDVVDGNDEIVKECQPIPYMWAFDDINHAVVPLQFFEGSNLTMKTRYEEICHRANELQEFIVESVWYLGQCGGLNDLGIYLRYDDIISLSEDEVLVEETDVDNRRQWLTREKQREAVQICEYEAPAQWYTDDNTQIIVYCFTMSNHLPFVSLISDLNKKPKLSETGIMSGALPEELITCTQQKPYFFICFPKTFRPYQKFCSLD